MAGKGKPGRPKGVPNKMTTAIREAVFDAMLMAGKKLDKRAKSVDQKARAYLTWLATEEPRSFGVLLGKMLPSVIDAKIELPQVVVRNYTGVEWERKAQRLPESRVVDHVDPDQLH